jgi:hypothetical protein
LPVHVQKISFRRYHSEDLVQEIMFMFRRSHSGDHVHVHKILFRRTLSGGTAKENSFRRYGHVLGSQHGGLSVSLVWRITTWCHRSEK